VHRHNSFVDPSTRRSWLAKRWFQSGTMRESMVLAHDA
jgi:hypothetical protein